MGTKRFRMAFSFAGEKRDFVQKAASLLAHGFGKEAILYDKFHEAEFSRARLGRYLPKLYHEQSDLVVVVICRDYVGKEWCGLEWDAIFGLLKQRRENEVMLSRFDNAIVDDLFDAGFSDLDYKTPEQFAALILERLALNEGKPKDYYTMPPVDEGMVSRTSEEGLLPPEPVFFGIGPLTISAVLKGAGHQIINDAYPAGKGGAHFCFSLFNRNAFDFSVHTLYVDVLTYAPLNLDHLAHGVGATDVERYFQAKIRPEIARYPATYFGGRQGEYVTIPPGKSEKFDLEIAAATEGLYDVCVRILGESAGKRFDVPLDSTKQRVAFFDVKPDLSVDRGWGGRRLTWKEYSEEMKSWGQQYCDYCG
jgi:TIR domain